MIGRRPAKRRADAEPGEAVLGDRGVDHAPGAELLEQALAHLVGALILRDLLAHQEDVRVAPHLLGHRVAQRLAHGLPDHRRAGRDLGLERRRRRRRGAIAGAGHADRRRLGNRLRRLGRRGAACRRRRLIERRPVLAVAEQQRDRRVDRDALGPVRHQDAAERALVDRLDLHRRLVGLDLGDHVARRDGVALALEPAREVALGHGRRQGGHQDLGRHGGFLNGRATAGGVRRSARRRCRARPDPAPGCPGRSSPPR